MSTAPAYMRQQRRCSERRSAPGLQVRLVDLCQCLQVTSAAAAPVSEQSLTETEDNPQRSLGRTTAKPRVVILGSGWGAVSFIRDLPKDIRQGYLFTTASSNWQRVTDLCGHADTCLYALQKQV